MEYRRLVGQAEIKAVALKPDAEILTSRLSSSLKRDEIPTTHYAAPLVDQSAAHYACRPLPLNVLSSPSFRFPLHLASLRYRNNMECSIESSFSLTDSSYLHSELFLYAISLCVLAHFKI